MARGPKWSVEEDAIIVEEITRQRKGWLERAAARLPHRTPNATFAHAQAEGYTARQSVPVIARKADAPVAHKPAAPIAPDAYRRTVARGPLIPAFLADDFARWGVK